MKYLSCNIPVNVTFHLVNRSNISCFSLFLSDVYWWKHTVFY